MFDFIDDQPDSKSPGTQTTPAAGKVKFDDRGNAIYAWRDDLLEQDGLHAERLRERALLNPMLKLVDVDPAAQPNSIRNDKGLQVGYNPYQSGQLAAKKPGARKPDMRELSKWIELKRRLDAPPRTSAIKK